MKRCADNWVVNLRHLLMLHAGTAWARPEISLRATATRLSHTSLYLAGMCEQISSLATESAGCNANVTSLALASVLVPE